MLVGPEGLKWTGLQQDALKPLIDYRAPVQTVLKRKEMPVQPYQSSLKM